MTRVISEGDRWARLSQKVGVTFLKKVFLLNFKKCGMLYCVCVGVNGNRREENIV